MSESEARAELPVDDLTPAELASVTSGSDFWNTQALPSRGLSAMTVTDGPHGLRKQSADSSGITLQGADPATCFPTAAGLASTWDRALMREIGEALGAETRAAGVAVILGPGVNIKRHPLCGRNFEYLSEDPLLAGEMGAHLVSGIQSAGVGASVKHFACNNQETNRARLSADVDERPLREIYLRPFERVVRKAAPWTLMTANNKINGVYASEHAELLGILRDEWGFDGLVMSDWGSVYDRVPALVAGMDLEMPSNPAADQEVKAALENGGIPVEIARATASRVFRLAERASEALSDPGVADFDAHHALARRAAAQACVLLANNGTLPLDSGSIQRLCVVGSFAVDPRYQGAGSSQVTPTRIDDALTAIRARLAGTDAEVTFAPGFARTEVAGPDVDSDQLRAEAVRSAADADAVLLFLGLPEGDEAEGADRVSFELPEVQRRLFDEVAAVNPRTVVVLSNGSVVGVTAFMGRAAAILESWLGGQASGSGVADVLFGDVAPSGRLAESIPLRVEDCPAHIGWPGEEGHTRYGEGVFVGYRYYETFERPVAFPFGHGLGYTTFSHAITAVRAGEATVELEVEVTNSGSCEGREVVQIYASHSAGPVHRPRRELAGFGDITLAAGEVGAVTITVDLDDLAFWSTSAHAWVLPESVIRFEVGASSHDIRASLEVAVRGNGAHVPLTPMHTLREWLEDPVAGPALRDGFGVKEGDPLPVPLNDPDVFKVVAGTTMKKFVYFGMGLDATAFDRIKRDLGID